MSSVAMPTFNAEERIREIQDIESIKKLPERFIHEKVVLGIDIYKYSEYSPVPQVYVPVLFENLYVLTVANVLEYESFIFHPYCSLASEFKSRFIPTGDGGFQIFNNPMEAIVFSIYFQLNVKRFNSGGSKMDLLK